MSDSLNIPITGDASSLDKTLEGIKSEFKAFGQSAQREVNLTGEQVKKLERRLKGLGTGKLNRALTIDTATLSSQYQRTREMLKGISVLPDKLQGQYAGVVKQIYQAEKANIRFAESLVHTDNRVRQSEGSYNGLSDAQMNTGRSVKQMRFAMQGLPAQFTDIFVSLQGGQAPLTVLLQQGGQIKDMFGGLKPAFAALQVAFLSAFRAMMTPIGLLVTAGVALLGTFYLIRDKTKSLKKALSDVSEAISTVRASSDLTRGSIDKLKNKYGDLTTSIRFAISAQADFNLQKMTKEYDAFFKSFDKSLETFSKVTKPSSVNGILGGLGRQAANVSALQKTLSISRDDANSLLGTLNQVFSAENTSDRTSALGTLQARLSVLIPTTKEGVKALIHLRNEVAKGTLTTAEFNKVTADAAKSNMLLTDSNNRLVGSYNFDAIELAGSRALASLRKEALDYSRSMTRVSNVLSQQSQATERALVLLERDYNRGLLDQVTYLKRKADIIQRGAAVQHSLEAKQIADMKVQRALIAKEYDARLETINQKIAKAIRENDKLAVNQLNVTKTNLDIDFQAKFLSADNEINKKVREARKYLQQAADQTGAVHFKIDTVLDSQDAFIGMKSGFKTFAEDAQKSGDKAKAAIENAMSGATDALTDFVVTGKADFKSLANSIVKDLIRIALQKNITGPIADYAASLFPNAKGGVYENGVKKFANGGVVTRPTLFPMAKGGMGLMGEASPEAVMPLTRDAQGRLGVRQSGSAQSLMNVQVNVINQSGSEMKAKQSQPAYDTQMKKWVVNVFLEDVQRGGPLSSAIAGVRS